MKVLKDFHLIDGTSRAFYDLDFSFTSTKRPIYIVEMVLINNLGFTVLMVNSGTKHAFKYE